MATRRYYVRLAANGVLALRLRGFKSWGAIRTSSYFGGNSELRGYDYLEFIGHKALLRERRAALPADRGDADAARRARRPARRVLRQHRRRRLQRPAVQGHDAERRGRTRRSSATTSTRSLGNVAPATAPHRSVGGLRLVDARASYGIGLESFLLGFPMHFDWSWKTLFNRAWEDDLFRSCTQVSATSIDCRGDSGAFRKMKFSFWIGYDF